MTDEIIRKFRRNIVGAVLAMVAISAAGVYAIPKMEAEKKRGADSAWNSLVENSGAEVHRLPSGEVAAIDYDLDGFDDVFVQRGRLEHSSYRPGDDRFYELQKQIREADREEGR